MTACEKFRWTRHRVGHWSAHGYEIKRSSRRGSSWRILRDGTLWDVCPKLTDAKAACVRDLARQKDAHRRTWSACDSVVTPAAPIGLADLGYTPAEIAESDDLGKQLSDLLRECNVRPTLDMERSLALPCVLCKTMSAPRDLVRIGTYTRRMGGNLQPGDAITRPMCAACKAVTDPMA